MARTNPLPFALIGLGLGWLALSRINTSTALGTATGNRITGREPLNEGAAWVGRTAAEVRERLGEAAQAARGSASGFQDRANEAVQNVREQAAGIATAARIDGGRAASTVEGLTEGARQLIEESRDRLANGLRTTSTVVSHAGQELMDIVEDYPLAVGLMGLAVGAAIGASLPATRSEGRWLGQVAGDVIDTGKNLGRSVAAKATTVVRTAAQAGAQAAEEAATTGVSTH